MNINSINWQHLPGENNIFRTVLPNGIIVLSKTNFNSPSVILNGFLQGGSQQDPDDKLGLALFTSIALMRGTKFHKFKKIYNDLESVGSSFGFGASIQTTSFGGKSLIEDLPLLLRTLSESLLDPVFPLAQFRKVKSNFISGLQQRAQDTGEIASLRFDEILFSNHPYGRPEDGYIKTVKNITRSDVIDFHKKVYGPKGMVVVIVGAVEPNKVNEYVFDALGKWENVDWKEPPEIPPCSPLTNSYEEFLPLEEKFQMDLIMGCHGPSRISEDYLPASLGNNILGQFGMMGRIGNAVREKSGLAYYASTSLNAWLQGGSWEISAGINPKNYQKTIEIIKAELTQFIEELVTDEELEDSKSSYIGSLPLSVESNSGVANAIIKMERYGLGLNYLQNFPEKIKNISKEDIRKIAYKYINPDRMVTISSGPKMIEDETIS